MNKVEHNFRRGDHIFPAFFFAVPIFLPTFADANKLIDILSGMSSDMLTPCDGLFYCRQGSGYSVTRIFVGHQAMTRYSGCHLEN